ncbi:MAG: D-alanyl-D-alanine carboxypeptidase [Clostridia bacterium]|nr:D-alanyl-D-alanine carboxypeptidase [Clostridia bacterium]
MRKIIAVVLLMVCLLQTVPVEASQKNIDAITAPTYMLVDGSTDAVMLEENCKTDVGVNDFAKIMTAVLAIEKLNPAQSVPFTEETNVFYNSFGNLSGSEPGRVYSVTQHLQNMLLLYSDASAVTLAVAHSGSEKAFVAEMNKKAESLGMTKTKFTSPDGREDKSAGTTVSDLYRLLKHAMSLPLYREVIGSVLFDLPVADGTDTFSSRNHLLSNYTYSSYTYSLATGALVSFSGKGASLIAVAEQGDKQIYGFVINTPDDSTQVYKDMINLFEHGFNSFRSVVLVKKGAFIKQVPVKGAIATQAVLVAEKDIAALLPSDYDEELLTSKVNVPEKLQATVEKNKPLGEVSYYYNGNRIASCPIVSEKKIGFSPFSYIYHLFSGINTWLLLIVLVVFVWGTVTHQKKQRKKEALRRKKREIMQANDE